MKEKQVLHVFRQQITCARSPATEEAASPPPRQALGNRAGAMASKMFLHKLLIILSRRCVDAPLHLLPNVPGSPRGPHRAARPTPTYFSSRSQRSGLQLCPCREDLGGGFLILLPLHILFLMHFCQRPCYVVSF